MAIPVVVGAQATGRSSCQGFRSGQSALPAREARKAEFGGPYGRKIAGVIADFRPSAHVERLQLMDLLAVKECTDARFLPARFRDIAPDELERKISELRRFL